MSSAPLRRQIGDGTTLGGTTTFHPYLFFSGNCRDAFTRYQEILGGELFLMPMSDVPPEAAMPGRRLISSSTQR
jgi:uncharacterized glyoxalase superfamily protein PhnB